MEIAFSIAGMLLCLVGGIAADRALFHRHLAKENNYVTKELLGSYRQNEDERWEEVKRRLGVLEDYILLQRKG